MDSTKILDKADLDAVASAVGCTSKYVQMVLEGDRGVRRNELQTKIIEAWELRMKQKKEEVKLHNKHQKALIRYCNSKQITRVTLQ